MSDQPEALRLADALDEKWWRWQDSPTVELKAAACLRRQHAEIEALKAELDALRDAWGTFAPSRIKGGQDD